MSSSQLRVLGLTGDIASGKSTVASLLAKCGARVLDADALVHELYADTNFAAQIAALFSDEILDERGAVDRKKLGAVVFGAADKMQQLEALVHPAVARLREAKLQELRAQSSSVPVVVLEAVKLIESGQARGCNEVWCITSTPEIQLQRLTQMRGLSVEQARARLAAQPSRAQKQALLHKFAPGVPLIFLENNGTLEALTERVDAQWQRLLACSGADSSQR